MRHLLHSFFCEKEEQRGTQVDVIPVAQSDALGEAKVPLELDSAPGVPQAPAADHRPWNNNLR